MPKKLKSRRPKRTPLGSLRLKMSVEGNFDGYHTHWINDVNTNLHEAQQAGYEFVERDEAGQIGDKNLTPGNQDLGSMVSRVVGTKSDGTPQHAYLMKLPQEFYEEDMAELEKRNSQIDEAIQSGTIGNQNVENSYFPNNAKSAAKISRNR